MPCFDPRDALVVGTTDSGKRKLKFANKHEKFTSSHLFERTKLPCGKCAGCRLTHSRSWALRCLHEASLYPANSFITLTYADPFLPLRGDLEKPDFQKFMKRLRERIRVQYWDTGPHPYPAPVIRFYACGEYGEKFARPHYHAIIFGYGFPDKYKWQKKRGSMLYRSDFLEELWPVGQSLIGDVTMNSAAYVARYIMKKQYGGIANSHYEYLDPHGEYRQRTREFSLMSRRPGIARGWIDKNPGDVYPKDFVTLNGKVFRPPKYYDRVYELAAPSDFAKLKAQRVSNALDHADDNTFERLKTKERLAHLNLQKLERSFEK